MDRKHVYPQEVTKSGKSGRLKDYNFTDISFDAEGTEFYIRGLDTSDYPMEAPPPHLLEDCKRLHVSVVEGGKGLREYFIDYDSIRYRVARADTIEGSFYALRRAIHPVPRFNTIGLNPEVARALLHQGKHGHGLILFSGETGQGKTTTACSLLLAYLEAFGDIAVTIEDPPELKLHGKHGEAGYCWQLAVEKGDFSTPIKQTMRYNPRYILLGEIRTADEASEALRAAINGHLVITTIHAGSVQEAINALLKRVAGKEPIDLARSILADGLIAVIQQRRLQTKGRTHLRTQFVFSHKSSSVRAKIREGKLEQLGTDIESQANRVVRKLSPVGN